MFAVSMLFFHRVPMYDKHIQTLGLHFGSFADPLWVLRRALSAHARGMQAWNKGATHFAGIAKLQTRPQICCDSMCLAPEPWNSSAQGQHSGLKNGLRILFGETLLLRISDGRTSTGFICDRGLDYKITSYDRHKAALGVWAVGGQWHDLPPAFSSMITPHDCSAWFGRTIEPFAICTVMPTWRLQVFAECHWSDIFPLSSFLFLFLFLFQVAFMLRCMQGSWPADRGWRFRYATDSWTMRGNTVST